MGTTPGARSRRRLRLCRAVVSSSSGRCWNENMCSAASGSASPSPPNPSRAVPPSASCSSLKLCDLGPIPGLSHATRHTNAVNQLPRTVSQDPLKPGTLCGLRTDKLAPKSKKGAKAAHRGWSPAPGVPPMAGCHDCERRTGRSGSHAMCICASLAIAVPSRRGARGVCERPGSCALSSVCVCVCVAALKRWALRRAVAPPPPSSSAGPRPPSSLAKRPERFSSWGRCTAHLSHLEERIAQYSSNLDSCAHGY